MARKGPEAVKDERILHEAKNSMDMKLMEGNLKKDGYTMAGYWMIMGEEDEQSFKEGLNKEKNKFDLVAAVNCASTSERTLWVKRLSNQRKAAKSPKVKAVRESVRAQL